MALFTSQPVQPKPDYSSLKSFLPEVVEYYKIEPSPKAVPRHYVCPFCNSGKKKHKTGGFSITEDGQSWHCFSCKKGGDALDLIGEMEGTTNKEEQLKKVNEIIGEFPAQPQPKKSEPSQLEQEKIRKEAERQINSWHGRIDSTDAQNYLKKRGLTRKSVQRFKLGWDSETQAVVIPYPGYPYWIKRLVYPAEDQHKYDKPKTSELGKEPIFNERALAQKEPVFVCEGQLNAISIEQAGGHAIAIGGVAGQQKLIEYVQNHINSTPPLIISFDNDQPGRDASQNLSEMLQNKCCIGRFSYGDLNDINDLLIKNPAKLEQEVKRNATQAIYPDAAEKLNKAEKYLQDGWQTDFEFFRNRPPKKTGFKIYDSATGGMYPGLYVIGAMSSLGKTTLMHQTADQMAATGEHVLYFSLEQSQFELVNKSLARTIAKRYGTNKAISAIQIRTGDLNENQEKRVATALQAYRDSVENRMIILKPPFGDTQVKSICDSIEAYIKLTGTVPIVFIDYLQLLEAPEEYRFQDKQKTDYVIKQLKQFQSEHNMTMIVISSFNRSNYMTQVGYESFKESGLIEYSADVVLGLQFSVLDNSLFLDNESTSKVSKKRVAINFAKARNPREIKLVCLKNRYGKTNFIDYFDYYPACDLFEENIETLAKYNADVSNKSIIADMKNDPVIGRLLNETGKEQFPFLFDKGEEKYEVC